MLSRAMRHRLGLTVAGASSPSMKAYSPRFHSTVPLAVRTMPVRHRRDQPALGRLEVGDVGERQRRRHGGIGGPGRGFGVARGVEMRRGNRNGGRATPSCAA